MKKYIVSTITAILVVVSSGIAQQEQEIIVIEQNRRRHAKKTVRLNDNTSVFKFTPTQMLVGEINFSFEKQISKNSSFEIGAGPTISNIAFGQANNNHFIDPWGTYAYQTSRLGMFIETGYRYYPLDETEALNRFYLSPVMKFKMMNFGLNDVSGNLSATKGNDIRMDFALNVGHQLWVSKTFSLDFYTGLGIGYQQVESYVPVNIFTDPDWSYQWLDDSFSGARYVFNFGVKVGVGHK